MTEMEAYSVKTRKSEPVGSRGNGSLLLERKASGAVLAYFRERSKQSDKRLLLGAIAKNPRPDTDERTLTELRAEALGVATKVSGAGGLDGYLALLVEQEARVDVERVQRQRQSEIEAKRGTFGEMLDAYVQSLEDAGKVSAAKVRSLFRVNVHNAQPVLAARYANEIRPEEITQILDDVLERKPKARGIGNTTKPADAQMLSTADELRRYLRTAFNFAAASHLATGQRGKGRGKIFAVNSNPASLIPPIKGASGGNTDSLTPKEFAELLRYLDGLPERRAAIANAAIYFGGQRIKQLLAATWDCLSEETLSLFDAKGKKAEVWEHLLPVTPRINEIIEPLLRNRIASGPFALTPGKLAHRDTISHLFGKAGETLHSEGKARKFSWLDVRATVETLLASQNISKEVRAWLLSHGRGDVQSKHYDRYSYLPEKRVALEQWGCYLDRLKAGDDSASDDVVLLSKRTI